MVFCDQKYKVRRLAAHLGGESASVGALTGNHSQAQRERTLGAFRAGRLSSLVATDVAARGLDIQDVAQVIHYELPTNPNSYVHRTGRTGRAEKEGATFLILSQSEEREYLRMVRQLRIETKKLALPALVHSRLRPLCRSRRAAATSSGPAKSSEPSGVDSARDETRSGIGQRLPTLSSFGSRPRRFGRSEVFRPERVSPASRVVEAVDRDARCFARLLFSYGKITSLKVVPCRRFNSKPHSSPAEIKAQAIDKLVAGIAAGRKHQALLGVTGSGKTFTMANVVAQVQKPTLVLVHNKTLAGQLYQEFKQFFPHNAVEYFVSYYDYYQPEAYIPQSNTYIAKDASSTMRSIRCGMRRRPRCSNGTTC